MCFCFVAPAVRISTEDRQFAAPDGLRQILNEGVAQNQRFSRQSEMRKAPDTGFGMGRKKDPRSAGAFAP
jgi:hypothetical protein